MKRLLLACLSLCLFLGTQAQITTSVSSENTTCSYSSDGSYTVDGIYGCYPPLVLELDSDTAVFSTMTNDGFDYLVHGASPDTAMVTSVWGGVVDSQDIVISTGYYRDSISFGATTLYSEGSRDIFLVCHDAASGNLLWSHSAGGANYDGGNYVTVLGNTVYVTGYVSTTAFFGSDSIISNGSVDGFIAKYNAISGNLNDVVSIGSPTYDYGQTIRGVHDQLYITGGFIDSITLAGSTFTGSGSIDIYVMNMDTSFTESWAETATGAGFDVVRDLAVSEGSAEAERIYISGYLQNNLNVGTTSLSSTGAIDAFVAALDNNGNWIWAEAGVGASGGSAYDEAYGLDVSDNGDTLFVAGYYFNSLSFGSVSLTSNGLYDGYIVKFDTNGNAISGVTIGGSQTDALYDIEVGGEDLLFIAGQIQGSVSFADSTFTSNGNLDAFMGKLTSDYTEVWGKNLGGNQGDNYNSIHLGGGERIHAAGFFRSDASSYQSGLISAGGQDAIITSGTLYGQVDTSFTISGLAAGSYTYILSDGAGNTFIDTITISSPAPISIAGNVTNASSGTANDGSIDVTVTGGTPGYTYTWSTGSVTEDLDSLVAGTYCLTVTDTNGCIDTTCFVVDSVVAAGPFMVSSMVTQMTCAGDSTGAIDLTVTGGTMPYSYNWSTGDTIQDLTGLLGGTYYVTVNDADTGSYIDSFVIVEPSPIVISEVITSPSSGSALDGAIDITVTGGVTPYSYVWSNAATTEDLTGLGIGLYTVTVTDSLGCQHIKPIQVDTLAALSLVTSASDVTCINTNNGAIDLTIIGGLAPFTINWSNGATTEDISGLTPGSYSVTVTDSAGQSANATDSVGSNPMYPDPVVGPISGPASAQAWTSYNYSVPSTGGSLFDWWASVGVVTGSANNAAVVQWNAGPIGMVYVSETDANGCWAVDSLEVTILFVGMEETTENAVVIYPNPTLNLLNLQLPEVFSSANYEVRSINGQLVATGRVSQLNQTIDVSELEAATYVLILEDDHVRLTHRFIKE